MSFIAIEPAMATGALLGFIGGVLRVFTGVFKGFSFGSKIYWKVTMGMALISGVVGLFLGALFNFAQPLSLIAGFAGYDVVDSVLKAFKTEKVIVTSAKVKGGTA